MGEVKVEQVVSAADQQEMPHKPAEGDGAEGVQEMLAEDFGAPTAEVQPEEETGELEKLSDAELEQLQTKLEKDLSPEEAQHEEAEPEPELVDWKTRAERLEEQLEAMARQMGEVRRGVPAAPLPVEPARAAELPTEEVSAEMRAAVMPFITESEYQDMFRSPEAVNAILSKVYNGVWARVQQTVPEIINAQVSSHVAMRARVDRFLDQNKDIAHRRELIRETILDLGMQHPEWQEEQLFSGLGDAVRQKLGFDVKVVQQAAVDEAKKTGGLRPAVASVSKGSRKPAPRIPAISADLEDMANVI